MSGLKKEESFTVDGVAIAAPSTYKPVFATTSTKSSKRDQELSMHNSPMGTIGGYDLTWDVLSWEEIAVILNGMINKSEFTFHHKDPTTPGKWIEPDVLCVELQYDSPESGRKRRKAGRIWPSI